MSDKEALEPEEYFADVKTRLVKAQKDAFDKQLLTIKDQILKAKKLDQKTFLHRLVFAHDVIIKEQQCLAAGFDRYVLRDDVLKFIRDVKPKNSVKIIELARFPRAIPTGVQDRTLQAKSLEVFDDFLVLFTDLTENRYTTDSEKKFVERNRDPIIFGMFKHERTGLKHDRLYYIDSWQDEFCDLDFPTMVERMAEIGIQDPISRIETNDKYLNQIIKDTNDDMENDDPEQTYKEALRRARKKRRWYDVLRFFGRD